MILQTIYLLIFIGLFIKGFHAITRHGKLLSFLGFDETTTALRVDRLKEQAEDDISCIEDQVNSNISDISDYYKESNEHEARAHEMEMVMDAGGASVELINKRLKSKLEYTDKPYPNIVNMWSECEVCMSSFWGFTIMSLHYSNFLYERFNGIPFVIITISLVSLAGLVSVTGLKKTG